MQTVQTGTTSRLHAIDPVFIRSGRLDMVVEIATKLPQQRYEILQIITKCNVYQQTRPL